MCADPALSALKTFTLSSHIESYPLHIKGERIIPSITLNQKLGGGRVCSIMLPTKTNGRTIWDIDYITVMVSQWRWCFTGVLRLSGPITVN